MVCVNVRGAARGSEEWRPKGCQVKDTGTRRRHNLGFFDRIRSCKRGYLEGVLAVAIGAERARLPLQNAQGPEARIPLENAEAILRSYVLVDSNLRAGRYARMS